MREVGRRAVPIAAFFTFLGSCGGDVEDVPLVVEGSARDNLSVAVYGATTCRIDTGGVLSCWGNAAGSGVPDAASGPTPKVLPIQHLRQVVLEEGGCALDSAGTMSCWNRTGTPLPVALPAIKSLETRSFTIATDGRVLGFGPYYLCGRQPTDPAVELTWAAGAISISEHACTVLADQTLWCLEGCGSATQTFGTGLKFTRVVEGFDHTCALTTDGGVYCLGTNYRDQCGVPNPNFTHPSCLEPTRVVGIPPAVGLWAADYSTCIIGVDETVWCWGEYDFPVPRRLMAACNDTKLHYSCSPPIQVPILHGAKQLALGEDHGCAIMADNHLLCWGDNTYGQLGQ